MDIHKLIEHSMTGLFERDEPVRLGILCALAGESIFFLGPPGVGKSMIARRIRSILEEGKSFEYLMGKFSTPDEIFGPVSIQKLTNDDTYERLIKGYLPSADIVFLDEVWNASPPIQNALLTAMNEKLFRNGISEEKIPMTLLIGASNSLHPGEETAAFWDRFLVRINIEPIQRKNSFIQYLNHGLNPYDDPIPQNIKITKTQISEFQNLLPTIKIPPAIAELFHGVRLRLMEQGRNSDRRWKKILHLLKASAQAHGRDSIDLSDCFLMEYCLWDNPDQADETAIILMEEIHRILDSMKSLPRQILDKSKFHLLELHDELVAEFAPETEQPLIFDGEYYELSYEGSEYDQLLIWKPDGDDALTQPRIVECFAYKNNQLVKTLSLDTKPGKNPFTILVDLKPSVIGKIKTEIRKGVFQSKDATIQAFQKLPAGIKQNWTDQLTLLQKELTRAGKELGQLDSEIQTNANEHMFVPSHKIRQIDQSLEQLLGELFTIQQEINQFLASNPIEQ